MIGAPVGVLKRGGLGCFEPTPVAAGVDASFQRERYWRIHGMPQQCTGGAGHYTSAWVSTRGSTDGTIQPLSDVLLGCGIGLVLATPTTSKRCIRQSDTVTIASKEVGALAIGMTGFQWTRSVSVLDARAVLNLVVGPPNEYGLHDIDRTVRVHDAAIILDASSSYDTWADDPVWFDLAAFDGAAQVASPTGSASWNDRPAIAVQLDPRTSTPPVLVQRNDSVSSIIVLPSLF